MYTHQATVLHTHLTTLMHTHLATSMYTHTHLATLMYRHLATLMYTDLATLMHTHRNYTLSYTDVHTPSNTDVHTQMHTHIHTKQHWCTHTKQHWCRQLEHWYIQTSNIAHISGDYGHRHRQQYIKLCSKSNGLQKSTSTLNLENGTHKQLTGATTEFLTISYFQNHVIIIQTTTYAQRNEFTTPKCLPTVLIIFKLT